MEFSDYLKQAEELEKEAEELTNEAGDFEQDAETLEERRMRKHQKQPSRKKPKLVTTQKNKSIRDKKRAQAAARRKKLLQKPVEKPVEKPEEEKPQLPAVIRKDGTMVKRADGTMVRRGSGEIARTGSGEIARTGSGEMVRKDKAKTGTVIPPKQDKNEIGPTLKKKRTVINVPPRRKDFQPPAKKDKPKLSGIDDFFPPSEDKPKPERPKPAKPAKPTKPAVDVDDEGTDELPVTVGAGWDDPKMKFRTTGQPKMFPTKKKKEEDGKQLDPKKASQRAELNDWKVPEGEPILFERSKKGLERIIKSRRTSQQQKNKARKQLQLKRQQQIKRADKTAADPNTDLATAVRAADASIEAKEKVKKYQAPPEKKKVKTDFGPPEKAFKDN